MNSDLPSKASGITRQWLTNLVKMHESFKEKIQEYKSFMDKVPAFKLRAVQRIQEIKKDLHARIESSSVLSDSMKKSLGGIVDPTMDEEQFSMGRLQKLQEKMSEAEGSASGDNPDSTKMSERMEFDAGEKQVGVVHWCGNEDRFIDQRIRTQNEMSGTNQMFEIDPITNMPDDDNSGTASPEDYPEIR